MSRRRRPAAIGLIALMSIGSLMLWAGFPLLWVWIGSRLQEGSQPSMGPYAVVIVGVIGSMIVTAKFLSFLNGAYGRVTERAPVAHIRLPWHRSMRGERDSGRPGTVLDVVMVWTVVTAGIAFGLWFLLLAGSSLPNA